MPLNDGLFHEEFSPLIYIKNQLFSFDSCV